MKRCGRAWIAVLAFAGVQAGTAGVSFGSGTLIDLGHLSTNYYGGSGPVISADGRVVAGSQQNAQRDDIPFIWTAATGLQPLPPVGSYNEYRVYGINGDGSVIVGQAEQSAVPSYQAFEWTSTGGTVDLGGTGAAQATGLSADGNVIVGSETAPGIGNVHWVTWSGDGAETPLSSVPGIAHGVSADGSVIVGEYGSQAAYWTQQTGAVLLPLLPGTMWGKAAAVSGDGSTIVGYDSTPTYVVPPGAYASDALGFRWTADGGLEPLGHLAEKEPGHSNVFVDCVNGDGTVIGGEEYGGAFVWDEAHGMRYLDDVLTSAGIDIQGWTFYDVTGISADGSRLVGYASHDGVPNDFTDFLAEVPASVWVPEPGSVALMAVIGVTLLGRRRGGAAFI